MPAICNQAFDVLGRMPHPFPGKPGNAIVIQIAASGRQMKAVNEVDAVKDAQHALWSWASRKIFQPYQVCLCPVPKREQTIKFYRLFGGQMPSELREENASRFLLNNIHKSFNS